MHVKRCWYGAGVTSRWLSRSLAVVATGTLFTLASASGISGADANSTVPGLVGHVVAIADTGPGGGLRVDQYGFVEASTTPYGGMGGRNLNAPIVGMAGTPSRHGYWQVSGDGGVFAFGDASYFGSAASTHLNAAIVGIAGTSDGKGYWLVGADGGVFAYGDARYQGSAANLRLDGPIVAVASDHRGGYWLVGSDGGVFAFGGAPFDGSMAGHDLNAPVTSIGETSDAEGYVLAGRDGGAFAFGDATFQGTPLAVDAPPVGSIVGILVSGSGAENYYVMVSSSGAEYILDSNIRPDVARGNCGGSSPCAVIRHTDKG